MYKNKSKLYSYAIVSLLALTNISGLLYSSDVNASGNPKQIERKKQKKWTQEEDDQLIAAVTQYKPGEKVDWVSVAKEVSGRNALQCRIRWGAALDPNINRSPWTPEEDEKILEKYNELGPKWAKIEKFFPNRTNIQLISRYNIISGKNKITREKYYNKEEVKKQQKEYRKEYSQRPEVKKYHREYQKEYYHKKKKKEFTQQNTNILNNLPNMVNIPVVNPDIDQEEQEEQVNRQLFPDLENIITEMGFNIIDLDSILNQNE